MILLFEILGKLLIETPWHSTNSLKGKGDSAHKNTADFPPALTLERPMKSDLPNTFKPWDEVHLPVDILLLTVEDSEFLACFAFLRNAVKSYFKNLGYVYFGNMGESGDVPLKVALMTCSEGSSSPHGSLVTVQNAIVELRPKAAFYVGYSVDTSLQLGDVVVSSKLTADSLKTLVGRDILRPVRHADRGWIPPVKRPEDHKVQVCRDGDILSGINPISVKQQSMSHFTEATAYEIGCEGKIFIPCLITCFLFCYVFLREAWWPSGEHLRLQIWNFNLLHVVLFFLYTRKFASLCEP